MAALQLAILNWREGRQLAEGTVEAASMSESENEDDAIEAEREMFRLRGPLTFPFCSKPNVKHVASGTLDGLLGAP